VLHLLILSNGTYGGISFSLSEICPLTSLSWFPLRL